MDATANLAGSRLGRFRLTRLIGQGGMGEVYAAEDENLGREVAVKVLGETYNVEPHRRRFLREARLAARLNHPNIASIYEVGESEDRLYIVMELLEGKTLRTLIAEKSLTMPAKLTIARDVARALARAHHGDVIHRDIKPENVFITNPGPEVILAKVLDFGLARDEHVRRRTDAEATATDLTGPGEACGTAGYLAPEQARGLAIDVRADIFSFGAVVYEMLVGKRAFDGRNQLARMLAVVKSKPEPIRSIVPDISLELEAIVERCLSKAPTDRYRNGSDLLVAIENAVRVSEEMPVAIDLAPALDASRPRFPSSQRLAVATPGPISGKSRAAAVASAPAGTSALAPELAQAVAPLAAPPTPRRAAAMTTVMSQARRAAAGIRSKPPPQPATRPGHGSLAETGGPAVVTPVGGPGAPARVWPFLAMAGAAVLVSGTILAIGISTTASRARGAADVPTTEAVAPVVAPGTGAPLPANAPSPVPSASSTAETPPPEPSESAASVAPAAASTESQPPTAPTPPDVTLARPSVPVSVPPRPAAPPRPSATGTTATTKPAGLPSSRVDPPPAGVPRTGVLRVSGSEMTVVVDGEHRRVQNGQVVVPCGRRRVRIGVGSERGVDVPCGGSVTP